MRKVSKIFLLFVLVLEMALAPFLQGVENATSTGLLGKLQSWKPQVTTRQVEGNQLSPTQDFLLKTVFLGIVIGGVAIAAAPAVGIIAGVAIGAAAAALVSFMAKRIYENKQEYRKDHPLGSPTTPIASSPASFPKSLNIFLDRTPDY